MAQKKTPARRSPGAAKSKTPKGKSSEASPRSRETRTLSPTLAKAEYTPTEDEIAQKAYTLWESRGRPFGSAEEDWYKARQELRAGNGRLAQR